MVPKPSDVVRIRMFVRAFAVLLGFFVAAFGLLPLVSWMAEGITDGDLLDLSYYAPEIAAIFLFLITGGLIVLFSGLLARVAVPVPSVLRCPRCRYRLENLVGAVCPECGLDLDDEFMAAARGDASLARRSGAADGAGAPVQGGGTAESGGASD